MMPPLQEPASYLGMHSGGEPRRAGKRERG